jgi:hypothetical protein
LSGQFLVVFVLVEYKLLAADVPPSKAWARLPKLQKRASWFKR